MINVTSRAERSITQVFFPPFFSAEYASSIDSGDDNLWPSTERITSLSWNPHEACHESGVTPRSFKPYGLPFLIARTARTEEPPGPNPESSDAPEKVVVPVGHPDTSALRKGRSAVRICNPFA